MSTELPQSAEQPKPSTERRRAPRGTPKAQRTKLLICGEQPLYRAALSTLVERDRRFEVIAESTNNLDQVRRLIIERDVQLVLIDYDVTPVFGGGIEPLESLLDAVSPLPALVISSPLDGDACHRAIRHGASGIVFKTNGPGVLIAAIESAQRGQVWLERTLLPQMFDDSQLSRTGVDEKSRVEQLTPREREIMQVACTGITNKQIANKLSIAEATVRHHLGSIFAKLGVSTRAELVVFGYRHHLPTAVE